MSKCWNNIVSCFVQAQLKIIGVKLSVGKNDIPFLSVRKSRESKLSIGDGFIARKDVIINLSAAGTLDIGRHVFINDGTKINVRDSIIIGDDVLFGQDVLIYDHDHDWHSPDKKHTFVTAPVVIGGGHG